MLELDSGSWRDPHPTCYCWDPVSQKPKHKDIDECKDAFVFMYFKFYLGASWPSPAVTRFTNMAIVDKRVQLGMAQHNVLKVLIEP